jgi:hypothetical protein
MAFCAAAPDASPVTMASAAVKKRTRFILRSPDLPLRARELSHA